MTSSFSHYLKHLNPHVTQPESLWASFYSAALATACGVLASKTLTLFPLQVSHILFIYFFHFLLYRHCELQLVKRTESVRLWPFTLDALRVETLNVFDASADEYSAEKTGLAVQDASGYCVRNHRPFCTVSAARTSCFELTREPCGGGH